jgi:ATP-dependent protease ClpP protease subunit
MQQHNRAPITVYIDSPDGRPASGELLLRLLKVTDQDYSPACRVMTVATARAASAAADLLSWGDYAIAFPNSTILYHGTRRTVDDPITVEAAATMAESLKLRNDQFAMRLARRHERFFFRYVTSARHLG